MKQILYSSRKIARGKIHKSSFHKKMKKSTFEELLNKSLNHRLLYKQLKKLIFDNHKMNKILFMNLSYENSFTEMHDFF
jgi:hypothetical protein